MAASQKCIARRRLCKAVFMGKIIKPDACNRCGAAGYVEAHHADYSKPFDVEWMCRRCHDEESRPARIANVESRRKHFAPCKCGRPAAARMMCRGCYARWRKEVRTDPCRFPGCSSASHTRGLCNTHRQREGAMIYAVDRAKPGPVPAVRAQQAEEMRHAE